MYTHTQIYSFLFLMISVRIKVAILWGGTWDFDVTHGTSDSQSTRSTSNSENSIVEFRDVNTVNTEILNMSIDDQLKMVREE